MRVGYARVSTDDQNLDRQRAALAEAGCAEVIEEIESGVKARNRLVALLARLTAGDELVVKSLDRLGRRAGELVVLLDEQHRRGVLVRILDMPWLDWSGSRPVSDNVAGSTRPSVPVATSGGRRS
jgi:DNA invertase Pin-like site-specific DNA recombinase